MAIGGQDLICVRQTPTSPIPPADLRRHLEDLGDVLFSDSRSPSLLQRKAADGKHKVISSLLHTLNIFLYFFFLLEIFPCTCNNDIYMCIYVSLCVYIYMYIFG